VWTSSAPQEVLEFMLGDEEEEALAVSDDDAQSQV
jgi:hypothetical protein